MTFQPDLLPRVERVAIVSGKPEKVEPYLPRNYIVLGWSGPYSTIIGGFDDAGWTMQDYIIPRLGSGMYVCTELTTKENHTT
jgi:hypothetical protein